MYADFSTADVRPLWREHGLLPKSPRTITPYIWRWETIRELAERAGALVGVDRGGDRRVLALAHPDLAGKPFATPTLWAGIQFLNGHESAPPHRHSPGALRFVLEGSGVWTLVNGDPVLMEPGDLVLTPSYYWHGHDNPNDEPMIWFDGLDLPMVQSLDAIFFDAGPDVLERYEARQRSKSESAYYGTGLRVITPERADTEHPPASPLLAYRWSDTDAALSAQLAKTSDSYTMLRYINPATGEDIMPTLRAGICRIRSGGTTLRQRKVGSSVIVVHHGAGHSLIGGSEIVWEQGDVFVVPSWCRVEHHASSDADLFELSDAPVLEKIGLARADAG